MFELCSFTLHDCFLKNNYCINRVLPVYEKGEKMFIETSCRLLGSARQTQTRESISNSSYILFRAVYKTHIKITQYIVITLPRTLTF
jgi:hypothetical protein